MKHLYTFFLAFLVPFISFAQNLSSNDASIHNAYQGLHSENDTIVAPIPLLCEEEDQPNHVAKLVETSSRTSSKLHSHIPNKFTPDYSKIVGEIPITESVTPTGGRAYNVPIKLPKGRQGLQPQINITYNSQNGNGLLGIGWSLSGLSCITRANKCIYYDEQTQGAKMNVEDAFYLDGIRLLLQSNNTNKKRYKSEQGHIIVEAYCTNQVNQYFKVYYPNGTIAKMGFADNNSNKFAYPVSEIVDKYGNYINLNYDYNDNIYRISKISYGKNNNHAHDSFINFTYKTRSDISFAWQNGMKFYNKYLLKSIISSDSNGEFSCYNLEYTKQKCSQVMNINCTLRGVSLNPLRFYYGDGSSNNDYYNKINKIKNFSCATIIRRGKFDGWNEENDALIIYPNRNPSYPYKGTFKNLYANDQEILLQTSEGAGWLSRIVKTERQFRTIFAANIDGIKGDEVIKINHHYLNKRYYKTSFKIYKGNGTSGIAYSHTIKLNSRDIGTFVHPHNYFAGDFNGDGVMDVFSINANVAGYSSKCTVYDLKNKKITFNKHVFDYKYDGKNTDVIMPFDYNADGKSEIIQINSEGVNIYEFVTNKSAITSLRKIATYTGLKRNDIINKEFKIGEINGDGKLDFILSPRYSYMENKNLSVPVSSPHYCDKCGCETPIDMTFPHSPYACRKCKHLLKQKQYCYKCYRPLQDDYNGHKRCSEHGLTIAVTKQEYINNGKQWNVYYNKGNGQFDKMTTEICDCDDKGEYSLADMNNDGTTDLVCLTRNGIIYTYPSVNGHLSKFKLPSYLHADVDAKIALASISNGNYYSNILVIKGKTIRHIGLSASKYKDKLLTGAVNSYGLVSKTRYAKMNDKEKYIYTQDFGSVYPFCDISSEITLVAETQKWYNDVIKECHTFHYQGAVLHLTGLGFRGFKRVNMYDNINSKYIYSSYDPKCYSVLVEQETNTSKITHHYKLFRNKDKIVTIHLDQSDLTDKAKKQRKVKTYEYDDYGNVTTDIMIHYPLFIMMDIKTIKYENHTSLDNYVLGVPTEVRLFKKYAEPFDRKTVYSYDNKKGIPKNISEFSQNLCTKHTEILYDSDFNIKSKQVKFYTSPHKHVTSNKYSADGRKIKETTNALGQTTKYIYNNKGELISETNFKNLTTTYAYDQLSRIVRKNSPNGCQQTMSYNWIANSNDYLYKISTNSNNAPSKIIYYDFFNRKRKSGVMGIDHWIYTYTEYDNAGRVYKTSLPTSNATKRWNINQYDSHDRIVKVTEANGGISTITYKDNEVTVRKGNKVTTKTYNILNDLVNVSDPGGSISYEIRADGQPKEIIAPGGVKTTFEYDDYGRQTKISDPSAGDVSFTYDAAGNIATQTNANNQTITKTYDQHGRVIREIAPELTTDYLYNNDGLLSLVRSSNNTSMAYTYDRFGQLSKYTETIDGKVYTEHYTYKNGLMSSVKYDPLNYTVNYEYNSNRHLVKLKHGNETLWTLNSADAFGNVVKQTYGNGVVVDNNFNSFGFPTTIKASRGSNVLQHYGYAFDMKNGNLSSRSDQKRNLTEKFEYDNLDRLIKCSALGNSYETEYLANGNIDKQAGVGFYFYENNSKPYATTGIENLNHAVAPLNQNITYSSFSRPMRIREKLTDKVTFKVDYVYNSSHERVKATTSVNNMMNNKIDKKLLFSGGKYEHITDSNNKMTLRLYIGGTPYSAPIVLEKSDNVLKTFYLHRDYLGSITGVTNQNGSLEAEYSYTAWGVLRNPSNWQVYAVTSSPSLMFDRGYTGHEHIAAIGLINMNARLYDPLLGRFLSPDPYVQAPDFTQNFNRYSYALNNPFKFTDPNGEFLHLIIGAIIGGTLNLIMNADNIHNFGDALGYFGIGAVAGALGAGIGTGVSAAIAGESFGAGFMMTNASIKLASGFTAGALSGAGGGFAGGFTTEFSNSFLMEGQSFKSSFDQGIKAGVVAGVSGGLVGGVMGGLDAVANDRNFFTGARNENVMVGIDNRGYADLASVNSKENLATIMDNDNPLITVGPSDAEGASLVQIKTPKGINKFVPEGTRISREHVVSDVNFLKNGKILQFKQYQSHTKLFLVGNRSCYQHINKGFRPSYLFNFRKVTTSKVWWNNIF